MAEKLNYQDQMQADMAKFRARFAELGSTMESIQEAQVALQASKAIVEIEKAWGHNPFDAPLDVIHEWDQLKSNH